MTRYNKKIQDLLKDFHAACANDTNPAGGKANVSNWKTSLENLTTALNDSITELKKKKIELRTATTPLRGTRLLQKAAGISDGGRAHLGLMDLFLMSATWSAPPANGDKALAKLFSNDASALAVQAYLTAVENARTATQNLLTHLKNGGGTSPEILATNIMDLIARNNTMDQNLKKKARKFVAELRQHVAVAELSGGGGPDESSFWPSSFIASSSSSSSTPPPP